MTQIGPLAGYGVPVGAAPRSSLPFTALWVGPFILLAVTLSPLEYWNWVVFGLGVLLAGAYLAYSIRARVLPNAEMILYIVWVTWALTGVFVAVSGYLFWSQWATIFQIWVLLVIISGLTFAQRLLSFNLFWFLVGAFLVGGYSFVTGEFRRAAAGGEEQRVAGLAMNANTFGWIMLLATVAMAYFWMLPTRARALKYTVLSLGMAAAGVATVLSGSRKALVGFAVFYVLWLWFCYRRDALRRPVVMAMALGLLLVGALLTVQFAREMPVGQRFQETWDAFTGKRMGGGGLNRLELYRVAWGLLLKNPVVGVGMDNFRVYSGGSVAHSEYAEIAADTGLVGFVLYFAIFVVLWRRCGRIIKEHPDPVAVRVAGLARALLIVVMILNLGRYNYTDKPAWIVFGSLIGYTSAVWQSWRAQQASAAPAAPAPAALPTPRRVT
ncbi:MAG: O-antigen ligase family protein [Planctomycetota bacterium]|nr:O-antigen ligase family protein [Planctomycetota bacterium]